MRKRAVMTLAAALIMGLATASAQPRKAPAAKPPAPPRHDLTIAVAGIFTSMDPQYDNLDANNALTRYVFEPLIRFSAKLQPEPSLAVSWRVVDEKTWEIRLREGVTFQDGAPFTADDVAFSLARVPTLLTSPHSFAPAVSPILRTEIVDPHTLLLRTAGPVPLLPYYLNSIAIVSKRHAEGMTTASFNSLRSAIGTGPYRVVSFDLGDQAVFQRNESWWDKPPAWNTVTYRSIPDAAARLAALRAGQADIVDEVPPDAAAGLKADPRFSIVAIPGPRLIYLAPDAARTISPFVRGPEGSPLEVNPLRDARIRRALSLAIDREALKNQVLDGYAAPTGQLMPRGLSGYDPAIPVDPLDPDHARRLLADAGYPAGFGLTLHVPNDRPGEEVKLAEAIARMWTQIGVITKVGAMPSAIFFGRARRGEFSMRLAGHASDTGEASGELTELLASSDPEKGRGVVFRPDKYANPKVDTIIEQALATIDPDKRESLYREAERLAMPDMPIIPLYHQVMIWALRSGLTFHPRTRERTFAWDVEPK